MKTTEEEFRELRYALSNLASRMHALLLDQDTARLVDLVRFMQERNDEDRRLLDSLDQQLIDANEVINYLRIRHQDWTSPREEFYSPGDYQEDIPF